MSQIDQREDETLEVFTPQAIGEKIRFIRERRRMTQTALAQRLTNLGVPTDPSMVARFEQYGVEGGNSRRPSILHMVAIALALNVGLPDLGVTEEEFPKLRLLRQEQLVRLLQQIR